MIPSEVSTREREAASFEDLPGKWQAVILKAERNRPEAMRRQPALESRR